MTTLYTILLIIGLLLVSVGIVILSSYIAHKKRGLSLDQDYVRKLLPGVDCGMCGEKTCEMFAKKVTDGSKEPNSCKLIRPESAQKIKEHFKPTYDQSSKVVAFVKCKGGCKAVDRYNYTGARSCAIEETLHSGPKACKYACLGCGDCMKACKYGAIKINKRGTAEVVRSRCTGCGACIGTCPNNLIEMKPLELSVGVVCNNQSADPAINKKCEVGCFHCGKCIGICPVNAIKIVDNVPVIDHTKCIECYKCVGVCPAHVISRL